MTSNQNEQVLRHLERHVSITALEAVKQYGIYRLAARISELRKAGNNITSELVTIKNDDGTKTRIARYSLG